MRSTTTCSHFKSQWAGRALALCCIALWCSGCLEGSGHAVEDTDGGTSVEDTVAREPLTRCPLEPPSAPDTGPRAYVALSNDDRVAVLDLSDPLRMDVLRCISIDPNLDWSDEPFDVAVAADGRWYTTVPHGFGFTFGQLWAFEAGEHQNPKTLNLVGEPDHLALSPDGNTIYVTALQNIERPLGPYTEPGQFIIIDRESFSIVAQYPIGLAAAGLDVSPDGARVAVTSAGTDEIFLFNTNTSEWTQVPVGTAPTTGSPTYQPFYLALMDEGRQAWVTSLRSGDVRLINLETGELVEVVELGEGAAPRGIVYMVEHGVVAVADTARDEVVLIDASTRAITARVSVSPPDVSAGAPFGVAHIPGTPYVLVSSSRDPFLALEPGAMSVIDIESGTVVRTVSVGRGPRLIAVAP